MLERVIALVELPLKCFYKISRTFTFLMIDFSFFILTINLDPKKDHANVGNDGSDDPIGEEQNKFPRLKNPLVSFV